MSGNYPRAHRQFENGLSTLIISLKFRFAKKLESFGKASRSRVDRIPCQYGNEPGHLNNILCNIYPELNIPVKQFVNSGVAFTLYRLKCVFRGLQVESFSFGWLTLNLLCNSNKNVITKINNKIFKYVNTFSKRYWQGVRKQTHFHEYIDT